MPSERSLADFEGDWTLRRDIFHADGTVGRFDGTAQFVPDAGGLAYVERGLLRLGAGSGMSAERRYRWDADLAVYFDDGRFFHHVPAQGGVTAHWCDPDQYDGRYDFGEWPGFSVEWRVRGPRKDYRMVSRYDRSGSA
ncbi:DUF6314 family protein [Tateyamaria sp. SN6-1]|uniref:DUF6314 family protein n=1 Tax=Tateyamaria sp. SN6-1 TaxID=3092148 RepID=UPI0039F5F257